MNNKRDTFKITFKGETKAISIFAREYNLKPSVVYNRIKMGWTIEEALELIPRIKPEKKKSKGTKYKIGNKYLSLMDISEKYNVDYKTLYDYKSKNIKLTIEEILIQKFKKRIKK